MSSARNVLGALFALSLGGCTSPVAELILVVRADPDLRDALRSVRVEAKRAGSTTFLLQRTYPQPMFALPGQIALIAADPDDARPVEVQVYADVGQPGREDFIHRVTTRFQRNAVLYVDVALASACRTESVRADCASLGLTCGAAGACVPIDRPGTVNLPSTDGGVPDAGMYVCRPRAQGAAPTTLMRCERLLDDAMERCGDGLDNDCDGLTDEGCCAQSCEGATAETRSHCNELRVAGGAMTLGEETDGGVATYNATPARSGITVSPYRIDAYEVTVARFRRFVTAGMPAPPASAVMFPRRVVLSPEGGGAWATRLPLTESDEGGSLCNWSAAPGAWESDPINCVDWYTAMAFCVWDGGRLPTEAEWEFAARYRPLRDSEGNTYRIGRRYPWGDRMPDCNDANFGECDMGYPRSTRPVGTRMNGVGAQPGWLGVYDLAGNLAEYTSDEADSLSGDCWNNTGLMRFSMSDPMCVITPAPGEPPRVKAPVIRGGSQRHPEPQIRGASRDGFGARWTSRERDVGFRCVRLR